MRSSVRSLSFVVTSGAALAVAACAVPASAPASAPLPASVKAAPTGWHIVASYPVGSSVYAMAASGPSDAWAVESCSKPCVSGDGVILRHWNGKVWQPQQQPVLANQAGNASPLFALPGSSQVWALYDLNDGQSPGIAVERADGAWAAPTAFPAGLGSIAVVAPSRSTTWAFRFAGLPPNSNSVVVRDTGSGWQAAPSPGISVTNAGASSATGIWVFGMSKHSNGLIGLAISRWNGSRWVSQAIPAAPSGSASSAASHALVVNSPADVWAFGYFTANHGTSKTPATPASASASPGLQGGGIASPAANATGAYWLLHWNGKTWRNVKVPYPLNPALASWVLGPDGHGGIWFAAAPVGGSREYLYHDTANGHWSRVPVPVLKGTSQTEIQGFAAIPGTSSVYAYGQAIPDSGGTEGVILKYDRSGRTA